MNVNIDISTPAKYYEYATIIAETLYDILKTDEEIELKDLMDLIPPFKPFITIDNWFDANTKKELEIFKINDLKHILSINCKKITGNKKDLLDRIWSIYHPSNKKTKKLKKKRNKNKNKNKDIVSVEDSDDNESSILYLIKKGVDIYLKNNLLTKEHKRKYRYRYITDNKWVFKEYPNRYEYLGILDNVKLVKTPIPEEIENYLMCM